MNCRRIEESIPLYVEGDLAAGKARTVAAHLVDCQRCAGVASEYRASQQMLKGYAPPDFSPVFFDELRAGVLREIDKQRRQPGFIEMLAARLNWNLALAAAMLVLLFAATVSYLYLSRGAAIPQQQVATGQPDSEAEEPHGNGKVANHNESPPEPAPRKARVRRRANKPRPVRRETLPVVADVERRTGPKDEEKLRIEIQTSDPNVRIIWFSSKSDQPLSSVPQTETTQEASCH